MKRAIEQYLVKWQQQDDHLPLLLRGARQVGKSYVVEKFAEKYFKNYVTVNFEFAPEFTGCFTSLDPKNIINAISMLADQKIIPGETLLFLDEIQDCPAAITALRYFKEKMPELHVIGAGSLLEFALNEDELRMPVGRIQFLHLKPLSFQEFLTVNGQEQLVEYLSTVTLDTVMPEAVHQRLLRLMREYMILGGMPAVVQDYLKAHDFSRAQDLQTVLLTTYRKDFGKYASKTNYKYLQQMFTKAPGLIAQQFKYSSVAPDMRSRDLKEALEYLHKAGLLHQIFVTQASGLPLNALVNEKKFKLLFLDVGLVKRATNLTAEILLQEDFLLLNRGAIAEQLVGQEIIAYTSPLVETELYYWIREQKSSLAEVDFVINVGSNIIPVEVKAGARGKLRSLRMFMQEKSSKLGVRISSLPLSYYDGILSIPFYMISEISRLVQDIL